MTLPISGEISYDEINVEIGNSTGTEASMDDMTAEVSGSCNVNIPPTPDFISDWYNYSHSAAPTAPAMQNVVVNAGVISVKWFDNSSDEDGFLIYRRIGNTNPPTGDWLEQDSVPANTNTWDDPTPAIPGTYYQYYVCAFNCHSSVCSGFSNVVTG